MCGFIWNLVVGFVSLIWHLCGGIFVGVDELPWFPHCFGVCVCSCVYVQPCVLVCLSLHMCMGCAEASSVVNSTLLQMCCTTLQPLSLYSLWAFLSVFDRNIVLLSSVCWKGSLGDNCPSSIHHSPPLWYCGICGISLSRYGWNWTKSVFFPNSLWIDPFISFFHCQYVSYRDRGIHHHGHSHVNTG